MAQSTNNLSLVLNQQDSAGVNVLNRLIGAITYAGVTGEFVAGNLPNTSIQAQTFPNAITIALQFYFKNTHATANITITATPQGGASVVVTKVGPGGVFANWSAATNATSGYTAISLTSDTAGGTYEYFIGG